MTTLREDVAALARRTAEEFNKIRDEIGDIDFETIGSAQNTTYGNYGFETVAQALDSLLYVPISITSFTNNKGTLERGTTVTEVTLSWKTNKTPIELTLDGESVEPTSTGIKLSNLNYTSGKTWTLRAIDEKGAATSKTTAISFQDGVYYGVGQVAAADINSAFLLGLTKKLQGSKALEFTVDAPNNYYIYYAFPSSYGTPTFYVGGFEGGFELFTTISFTNAQGYTSSYVVYRSTNEGLGNTKVKVS